MPSNISLAVLSITAFAPAMAGAAQLTPGGFSLELFGVVPIVCRAELSNNVVTPQAGLVSLGRMDEFCNDPNGYEIYAEHSPELANAVLVVDGVDVPLAAGGLTRVSRSDGAGIASRSVELRLPDGQTGGSLSFRVVAL